MYKGRTYKIEIKELCLTGISSDLHRQGTAGVASAGAGAAAVAELVLGADLVPGPAWDYRHED